MGKALINFYEKFRYMATDVTRKIGLHLALLRGRDERSARKDELFGRSGAGVRASNKHCRQEEENDREE